MSQGFVPLSCVWRSDVGRVRMRNEDALAVVAERGWVVLADGMGGYRGGDVAARMGVELVIRRLERDIERLRTSADAAEALAGGIEDANREIHRGGQSQPELAGMGATLVAGVFVDGQLVCAHVGDSRLYRRDGGGLHCLTRDHTMLQEQVEAGIISAEEARVAPYRGMLTRGLGVMAWIEPEVSIHPLRPDESYLLCSDGLTDMLGDEEIAHELEAAGTQDEAADRLVALANAHGGRDNISLILARVAGSN